MSDIKIVLEKLDKLDSRIDNIDITLVKQNASLDYHIRRTDIAEQNLEQSSRRIDSLESHKDKVMGAIAILGIIGTILLGAKELGLF